MKLTEHQTSNYHYFKDKQGRLQGEFKAWYDNGQLETHCIYKDDKRHGEFKRWHNNGQLETHCFYKDDKWHGEYKSWYEDGTLYCWTYDMNGEVVINFMENPELYPTTPEERTFFSLRHGCYPLVGHSMDTPHLT